MSIAEPSLRDSLSLFDLLSAPSGSSRQLAHGVIARRTGDGLRLLASSALPEEIVVSPGARIRWGAWTLEAEELPEPGSDVGGTPYPPPLPVDDPFEEIVDLDAVGERWKLRAWTPEDRFEPFGFGREKAVGAFLADSGLSLPQRLRVPVLEGARGIFWICGLRLARHAAVHAGTRRFCRLRYSINDRENT